MQNLGKEKVLELYRLNHQIMCSKEVDHDQIDTLITFTKQNNTTDIIWFNYIDDKMHKWNKGMLDKICSKYIHDVDSYSKYLGITAEEIRLARI